MKDKREELQEVMDQLHNRVVDLEDLEDKFAKLPVARRVQVLSRVLAAKAQIELAINVIDPPMVVSSRELEEEFNL